MLIYIQKYRRPAMAELKGREKAILEYITQHTKERGYPPTTRDVCAALGIKSTSTVHKSMETLRQEGYIRQESGRHRYGIESDQAELHEEVAEVPIVGRVAAGEPILSEQNIEGYFPLPAGQLGRGNSFMLTVHGNSMIEAGILNGDYVLVEEQSTAENGDIVVAMVEDMEAEATVKAFYRENGHIRLQPRNPEMDPIIVKDCKIVGKVKGVFRYLS